MAYYSIFPEKDTTLYSHPNRIGLNTGHDEILEIVKERGTSDVRYYPSRIVIKFKTSETYLQDQTEQVGYIKITQHLKPYGYQDQTKAQI